MRDSPLSPKILQNILISHFRSHIFMSCGWIASFQPSISIILKGQSLKIKTGAENVYCTVRIGRTHIKVLMNCWEFLTECCGKFSKWSPCFGCYLPFEHIFTTGSALTDSKSRQLRWFTAGSAHTMFKRSQFSWFTAGSVQNVFTISKVSWFYSWFCPNCVYQQAVKLIYSWLCPNCVYKQAVKLIYWWFCPNCVYQQAVKLIYCWFCPNCV